jgi:two-component system, NtrC family, nitrogen regulation sensor histidine kinase NtrY
MDPSNTQSTGKRRQQRITWTLVIIGAIIYFGILEGWFFRLESDLPPFGNILFALVNLNVILLLLMTYLVLRNIAKLIFERKRNILGHKLRTRLVIAFVGLSLIPTLPLFWLTTQFIFSSMDHWFTQKVEHSLDQSISLMKDYVEYEGEELLRDSQLVAVDLLSNPILHSKDSDLPATLPANLLGLYQLDGIFVFDANGKLLMQGRGSNLPHIHTRRIRRLILSDLTSAVIPFTFPSKREGLIARTPLRGDLISSGDARAEVVVVKALPSSITSKFAGITAGYEDYLQMKLLHLPLKISHFITYSIVTLLVIFAAIWFGFFLAKSLTGPIQALVAATRSVAEGDLAVELDSDRNDELGMLIGSFNTMVRDLREGQEQLATAYQALQQSHIELEDRRRYMEIVLTNIAAGVVSVDQQGHIITMNKSAEAIFGVRSEETRRQHYSRFLQSPHLDIVKSFMNIHRSTHQPHLEQQLHVIVGNRPMVLLIKVSVLQDESGDTLGVVVVFDDLTDLEKAQRMAAWREVARRIAHEIKNPLTPIQLGAQRLRRKYTELLEGEDSVLDECTATIIQQVEHMKHLVNEFSRFARLPRANPTPCDLSLIVRESIALYRHNFPQITFDVEQGQELPLLNLDSDQFKQVLINLLDNAIHALEDQEGNITVRLFYDPILKIARLECADNGHGLSPEDKLRVFEPYYSRKEKGTGLGLAIVASIVADHQGFIRVRDNTPRGTVFIIELPG